MEKEIIEFDRACSFFSEESLKKALRITIHCEKTPEWLAEKIKERLSVSQESRIIEMTSFIMLNEFWDFVSTFVEINGILDFAQSEIKIISHKTERYRNYKEHSEDLGFIFSEKIPIEKQTKLFKWVCSQLEIKL